MEFDSYAVIKVKGAEPEVFCIIWANPKQPKPKGFVFRTSDNMTESKARGELAKMGLSQAKIDSLIQQARENPR